jgi:tRNA-Thr(GGU) m(6)t(6)A37 methyltransferase TsaA
MMKTLMSLFLLSGCLSAYTQPPQRDDSETAKGESRSFKIWPVGTVRKKAGEVTIEIAPEYEKALLGLHQFSHIHVLYWFDRNDTPSRREILQVHPRGDRSIPLTGVFATRAPVRPNLIALSTCEIVSIEGRTIRIKSIDALDNSPVIDIKPLIPRLDLVSQPKLPDWVKRRPAKPTKETAK